MTKDDIIKSWRSQLEVTTQDALAKSLGISQQYLSDIMAGRRDIGPKLLKKLGVEKVVSYRFIMQNQKKETK